MTKLLALTPEQGAQTAVYRDRWLAIGLSTEPGNRQRAEGAIAAAYHLAGLAPPPIVLWLPSPLHGALALNFLGAQVGAQVWAQVRDQVGAQVWAQVGDQVGSQVRTQVWTQVRDQVGTQVRAQVGTQVGSQVCFGLHEAPWLAWAQFFRDACGIALTPRLQPLLDLAEDVGWWWPLRGACIVTEKPTGLHRDGRGRLHSETDPAISYGCRSWAVWAWHGVHVPPEVIEMPEVLTAERILSEPNTEVRRAMIERVGWERFTRLLPPGAIEVLDQDVDGAGMPRRLLRIRTEAHSAGALVIIHLKDPSTGQQYYERVHPEVRTCAQAVAGQFFGWDNDRWRGYGPAWEDGIQTSKGGRS